MAQSLFGRFSESLSFDVTPGGDEDALSRLEAVDIFRSSNCSKAAGNEVQKKHILVNIQRAGAIMLGNICMLWAFSDEGKVNSNLVSARSGFPSPVCTVESQNRDLPSCLELAYVGYTVLVQLCCSFVSA